MPVLDKLKAVFSSSDKSSGTAHSSSSSETPVSSTPAHAAEVPSASTGPRAQAVAFDDSHVTVVFVLGGPGAGKGTQCERIVRDYGFKHLSAGDLLRAEQNREGSTYGEMIKEHIRQGQIVPMEVTVKLLENAMHDTLKSPPSFPAESPLAQEWQGGKGRFLIDGFPRKMDQAIKFDETVCKSSFVLFINTTEEVMLDRLLERGKTSGRDDDNRESIVKRFRTFVETSMPVVDYYRKQGAVEEIDSSPPADDVYMNVRTALNRRLGSSPVVTHQTAQADPQQNKSPVGFSSDAAPAQSGGAIPALGAAV